MNKALKPISGVFHEDRKEAAEAVMVLPLMVAMLLVVFVWSCVLYVKAIVVLVGMVFALLAGRPFEEATSSAEDCGVIRLQQRAREVSKRTGKRSDV